jgi:DNA-binding LacI/PurR family transcriptional regulator
LGIDARTGHYGETMSGVGLVVTGDVLTEDRYIGSLVHALGDSLAEAGTRLLARVAQTPEAEADIYHFWHAAGGLDAVALLGVTKDDPRVRLLRRLGTPFAAVADSSRVEGFSAVVVDNAAMVEEIRRFLATRGYSRAIYVTGFDESDTANIRAAAFGGDDGVEVVRAERGVRAAVDAAVEALRDNTAAVIFDTDVAAAAALEAFAAIGKSVPDEVAVLSWTDSLLCQTCVPPITALDRRAADTGSLLAKCLLDTLESSAPIVLSAPLPSVVSRESA